MRGCVGCGGIDIGSTLEREIFESEGEESG